MRNNFQYKDELCLLVLFFIALD